MKAKPSIEPIWPLVLNATDAMRSSAFNHLFGQVKSALAYRKVSNADIPKMFRKAILFGIKTNSK
jgi:hypothetical protein